MRRGVRLKIREVKCTYQINKYLFCKIQVGIFFHCNTIFNRHNATCIISILKQAYVIEARIVLFFSISQTS